MEQKFDAVVPRRRRCRRRPSLKYVELHAEYQKVLVLREVQFAEGELKATPFQ